MMKKGSIQEEDIILIDIYAPNRGALMLLLHHFVNRWWKNKLVHSLEKTVWGFL